MASGKMTYAQAGVDIDAGDRMVEMIQHHVQRTHSPRVLGDFGGFAGMFRLDDEGLFHRSYRDPVLVSCTDGVGTKVLLAAQMDVHDTIGRDLVAMSVNDMIVQGAEPLFFLDYIGTNKLDPRKMTLLVKGVADGCVLAGCALLGGETAEMPDVYHKDEYDLAGFAVGVVERQRIVDGSRVCKGDMALGLASSGVHSNGYALVRAIVREAKLDLNKVYPELGTERTLGQVLLEPTRIYAKSVMRVLRHYKVKRVVTAMAHITGGGLAGNLERVLPRNIEVRISRDAWQVQPIFGFLAQHGGLEQDELDRVFNLGIGYVMIVRPDFADSITAQLESAGETVYRLGTVGKGTGRVELVE